MEYFYGIPQHHRGGFKMSKLRTALRNMLIEKQRLQLEVYDSFQRTIEIKLLQEILKNE